MILSDISFACNKIRFNYRVSCIISVDGKYLLHRKKGDLFWNLIGGRVMMGESSIDAVRREIWEELGCECKIDSLVHVGENFFRFNDSDYHELLMIFHGQLKNPVREIALEPDLEVRWFTDAELDQISIRPEYTREIIRNPNRVTQWLVNDERR